jgi:hypothetical protein
VNARGKESGEEVVKRGRGIFSWLLHSGGIYVQVQVRGEEKRYKRDLSHGIRFA